MAELLWECYERAVEVLQECYSRLWTCQSAIRVLHGYYGSATKRCGRVTEGCGGTIKGHTATFPRFDQSRKDLHLKTSETSTGRNSVGEASSTTCD